jgi:hypothetical protein
MNCNSVGKLVNNDALWRVVSLNQWLTGVNFVTIGCPGNYHPGLDKFLIFLQRYSLNPVVGECGKNL